MLVAFIIFIVYRILYGHNHYHSEDSLFLFSFIWNVFLKPFQYWQILKKQYQTFQVMNSWTEVETFSTANIIFAINHSSQLWLITIVNNGTRWWSNFCGGKYSKSILEFIPYLKHFLTFLIDKKPLVELNIFNFDIFVRTHQSKLRPLRSPLRSSSIVSISFAFEAFLGLVWIFWKFWLLVKILISTFHK